MNGTPRTTPIGTSQDIVIAWIRSILVRKGWTGTDLAREAGIAPSTLLRPLNDPDYRFTPTARTLSKLARASGIRIPPQVKEAAGMDDGKGASEDRRRSGSRPAGRPAPGPMVELRSSLPTALRASRSGEASYVAAPPWFEDDPTAFAFHVADDACAPWLKAGTLAFATRRRDPVEGDIVVVTGADRRTRVGPFAGIDAEGIALDRGAQAGEIIPFAEILDVAVVTVTTRAA